MNEAAAHQGGTVDNRRRHNERGEGVISAAIAVLIVAFLGVVVWAGFRATLDSTQKNVDTQIEKIGSE